MKSMDTFILKYAQMNWNQTEIESNLELVNWNQTSTSASIPSPMMCQVWMCKIEIWKLWLRGRSFKRLKLQGMKHMGYFNDVVELFSSFLQLDKPSLSSHLVVWKSSICFCVPQEKESHTGWEWHNGKYTMTAFSIITNKSQLITQNNKLCHKCRQSRPDYQNALWSW